MCVWMILHAPNNEEAKQCRVLTITSDYLLITMWPVDKHTDGSMENPSDYGSPPPIYDVRQGLIT